MTTLLTLLWIHFLADFVLQSDWMALNKSKRSDALFCHCLVYALPFWWFDAKLWAIAFLSHALIDGVTSRGTSRLWAAGKRHWFFVLIGFDQALHATVLLLGAQWLGVAHA